MTGRLKLALVLATGILSVQVANAATPDGKLWNGAWHMNTAKSHFGAVGTEQSEARTYDLSGGKLTVKSSSKDSAGKELNFSYSAGFDGKWYPMIGNPNADSIKLTAVSSRQVKATSRFHGNVTVLSTATVSADGKHLTLNRTYVARKGKPSEVLEFDR